MSLSAKLVATVGSLRLELEIDTGPGTLVVIGPNGAGKTSLLSLLLGALPAERGRVSVGESLLLDTEAGVHVPLEARRLGYLPQDYALFPHLTVLQNVEFALGSAEPRLARSTRAQRARGVLEELELETLGDRRTDALSGGERQRVALARALSAGPRALLLDEPLAALDVHSRREVRRFLREYLKRLALPTLLVTHDAADARELGLRIAVLESGKLTQTGTWDELAASPASRFVEEFVGAEGS